MRAVSHFRFHESYRAMSVFHSALSIAITLLKHPDALLLVASMSRNLRAVTRNDARLPELGAAAAIRRCSSTGSLLNS